MDASVGPVLSEARPFPGLRPFDSGDFKFFFGRTEQFYSLYRLCDRSRFVAVVGGSGSGKSSLVRAGLLPLLERETAENEPKGGGVRKWLHRTLRPGTAPIDELAKALAGLAPPEEPAIAGALVERIEFDLRRSSYGISDALSKIGGLEHRSILLVVDQFEELFRYGTAGSSPNRQDPSDEEADGFVQLLLEAARGQPYDVRILLTMRSDFIGDCARFQGLPEAVSACQFLVPSLTRSQLEEAIRRPIEESGAVIWPELVKDLLNDSLNEEDRLPVLQHCLLRLWEQSGRASPPPSARHVTEGAAQREIKTEHYEAIGGVATALSQHAEEVFSSLDGFELAVEQIFRALSELDKDGRATRRAIPLAQLIAETGLPEADVRRVLDRFRADDCSFILPSSSVVPVLAPDTTIDVGHEAFLRRWRRISGAQQTTQLTATGKSEGWLVAEHRDGERYRAWLSMFDGEMGAKSGLALMFMRTRWWWARRRTAAWAERYGGHFERVRSLLKRAFVMRWAAGSAVLVILATISVVLLKQRHDMEVQSHNMEVARQHAAQQQVEMEQQRRENAIQEQAAETNFTTAVRAASAFLDDIPNLLNKGALTVTGAKRLLETAQDTVDKVSVARKTPATTALVVKFQIQAFDLVQLLGDDQQGAELARKARDLEQPWLDAAPDDPDRLTLMYESTIRIGDGIADQNLGAQNLREALGEYQRAQTYADRLVTVLRDNSGARRMQAILHQKIGDIRLAQENPKDAITEYQAALDICEDLLKQDPGRIGWRQELATSQIRLSQPYVKLNEFDKAEEQLRASLSIRMDLLRQKPDDVVLQSHVAASHIVLGRLLAQRNDLATALLEINRGMELRQHLADSDRDNAIWKSYLAAAYIDVGKVLVLQGEENYPGALKSFERAYELRQQLVQHAPDSVPMRQSLADSETALADALAKLQRLDQAMPMQRNALAIWQTLSKSLPGNIRVLRGLFESRSALGEMLAQQKDTAGALGEYNEALAIAQRLAEKGSSIVWESNVALARDRITKLQATATNAN